MVTVADAPRVKLPSFGPRYQIVRRIKQGGMAEVFEAYLEGEQGFKKRFAIKRPLELPDAKQAAGFADEARILNQLSHPNIIQVFDLGIQDGWPYQVLEYVDGLTLSELYSKSRIQKSAMPPEVALHISEVVASALHHAHEAERADGTPLGIIHRDVSPQNIIVSWRGDVKVIDFGIAFADEKEAKTKTGVVRGKLSFMAPEQLYGEAVTKQTDLFALGCVLHAMMLGQSPLTAVQARADINSGKLPELDESLPEDIRKIIVRALQADPAARFASGRAFAQACRAAMQARGVEASDKALKEWLGRLKQNKPLAPANPFVELFQLDAPSALDDGQSTILDPNFSKRHQHRTQAAPLDSTRPLNIGRYVLDQVLQPAGLGSLYLAHADGETEQVFLKAVPKHALQSQALISQFFAEAAIFSHLEHPHLLKVLDFGTASNYLFMALERPPGRSLREILDDRAERTDGKDWRFSWTDAGLLAEGLLLALQEIGRLTCDDFDLSKRDIRPETIFFGQDGTPKLFDYALVSTAERASVEHGPWRALDRLYTCLLRATVDREADQDEAWLAKVADEQLRALLRSMREEASVEALLQGFEQYSAQAQPRLCELQTEIRQAPQRLKTPSPRTETQSSGTGVEATQSSKTWWVLVALIVAGVGALGLAVWLKRTLQG